MAGVPNALTPASTPTRGRLADPLSLALCPTVMALHSVRKAFHLSEDKHQMLNLDHRLETYLSRVKLLEEENLLLAQEIQALRCLDEKEASQRKSLEEKLRQARLEVDSAWRERAHLELQVGRLMEELQDLDAQRQREARAQLEANKLLGHSRKELEQEQRAQTWLSETVAQLEQEARHLTQAHRGDVAHLEATPNRSRATRPPTVAQRADQRAEVLRLGQEYSQQATRAWQEAAQAHQGQLARLEDSVGQARSHLMQANQEKSRSRLKLQVLEKELAAAQDIKMHLEKSVAQQGRNHGQQVQELQVSPERPDLRAKIVSSQPGAGQRPRSKGTLAESEAETRTRTRSRTQRLSKPYTVLLCEG